MITSQHLRSTGRKIKHLKKSNKKALLKGKSKKKQAKSTKRRRSLRQNRKPRSRDGGFTVQTPIIPFNTCKVFKAL